MRKNLRKIAAVQMCSSHIVDENLITAGHLIAKAARQGASLVVLPEMFAMMGKEFSDKVRAKEVYGHGKIQDFLSAQARKYKIWIVGGTIPIVGHSENKIKAASIIYNESGNVVARYDKIHLFDVTLSNTESYRESDTTEAGQDIVVVDTPVGKLGLSVCYDIRFPSLYTNLVDQGAEIIAVPSAFTVKTGKAHWRLLCRARAVENFCYVIGSAQEGIHSNGRQTYGHSVIVGPWGRVVQEQVLPGEGVVYADVDLEKLYAIRASFCRNI